jgi:MoxR-like ATPase
VFTQLLLADEINRATPKTQSALLEAMEEKSVTVGRVRHRLEEPFMVLATQNPIEMEGTYPLPEAQLDRFLLKLGAAFPSAAELSAIVDLTTGGTTARVEPVMDAVQLEEARRLTREVIIAGHVKDYAIRVVLASHAESESAPELTRRFVRHGASPRGVLAMIMVAKAFALFDGRANVSFDDLKTAAMPALRHRLLLNFEGEAEGIAPETIITAILDAVPMASGVRA